LNLSTEGLERSTAYVRLRHQRMREEAEAMTELLDAIDNAFDRREGVDWRRLRTLAKVKANRRTQVQEMDHWWLRDITLMLGLAFSWSLLHVTRHEVQLYIREDGELVKRAVSPDQRPAGVTSVLDLEALNLEERRALTQALNRFNRARA
jgi:hypothetical protein